MSNSNSADKDVRPSGKRLATGWAPVERDVLERNRYPCTLPSSTPTIHDLAYYQGILRNKENFTEKSRCDVFNVSEDGVGEFRHNLDDEWLRKFIQVSPHNPIPFSA